MGRCVERAGSRDQRRGVSPAEGEAAAVERRRRRLEVNAGKLHGLTPTQANGQLLEAIAAASVGLGSAAQRLAAYEAAEVTRVQREGPRQGGAGIACPAEAEEVAERRKSSAISWVEVRAALGEARREVKRGTGRAQRGREADRFGE
jgi:hypothetical protein